MCNLHAVHVAVLNQLAQGRNGDTENIPNSAAAVAARAVAKISTSLATAKVRRALQVRGGVFVSTTSSFLPL
jgi:hypothetical protein